jgi:hypothetical protein
MDVKAPVACGSAGRAALKMPPAKAVMSWLAVVGAGVVAAEASVFKTTLTVVTSDKKLELAVFDVTVSI